MQDIWRILWLGLLMQRLPCQNSALAAESLGLGICYIGAIRNDPKQIREFFDLPDLVFPVFGMTLGWPVDPPLSTPQAASGSCSAHG